VSRFILSTREEMVNSVLERQYDLPTGAEVGVYATDKPDINIPGYLKELFITV